MTVVIKYEFNPPAPPWERLAPLSGKAVNSAFSRFSRAFAESAAAKMSKMLAPGAKENVGATGRASENIYVGEYESGGVIFSYVGEGSYHANQLIREGTTPGEDVPSVKEIVDWMAAKNWWPSFYYNGSGKKRRLGFSRMTRYGGARAKSRKLGPRPFKTDLREKAAHVIIGAIKKWGTSSNHVDLFPRGKRKFDYVWRVARNKYVFYPAVHDYMLFSEAEDVIVKFLQKGELVPYWYRPDQAIGKMYIPWKRRR